MWDFAVMRVPGQMFSAEAALQVSQETGRAKGLLAMRRRWDGDLAAVLRAKVPGFVPPAQAAADYAEALVGRGVLSQAQGGQWQSDLHRAPEAKEQAGIRQTL